MPERLLTFVHISDTHLHSDPDFTGTLVDFSSRHTVDALIRHINSLPFPVDFVLHTGDIMTDPTRAEEYHTANHLLSALKPPVYYLPGNHDTPELMQIGLLKWPSQQARRPYYYDFEVNGVQIVCLDTTVLGGHHGQIDDAQLAWLDGLCRAADPRPLIVAMHHHALPLDAPWLDRIMLLNGEAVHQTLLKAKARLRGVFFGHIHENTLTLRDDIPYISTLSGWFQTRTWHGQEEPYRDPVSDTGFNVVTVTTTDLLVRGYRVPRA